MSAKKVSKNLKDLDQIKKEKGATRWGRLITEEKSANAQVKLAQKSRE